ncbi:2-dehydropantoate 2-reductase N-terminal domain-containing protein [Nocardia sp. R6R-6]|uniref:2-dehydropantoate 2-reductase N-terminal domain-containing protein n=1 Tax=Nocardia sp. R6R-6 TaxID=3459303 RepID=UPI00403D900D
MTRYVIVGAGAVGASLAVELAGRGHDILVIARGSALEHLAAHPLSYHTASGRRSVRLPVAAVTDDVRFRTGDILVLATKTQDVRDAAQAMAWREVRNSAGDVIGTAAEHVPVVTLQNGLDAERTAARWFEIVIGAVFLIAARYVQLGEIRVGGSPYVGSVIAGVASGDRSVGQRPLETFVEDLRQANFLVRQVSAVSPYKAAKILHSVRNGLEVLAGESSVKDAVGAALAAETRTVLTAADIAYHEPAALRGDQAQNGFSAATGVVPGQQSTWQSFARGAASNEVDYLNGEIVLLARQSGVDAPLNTRLQQILGRAAANGAGWTSPDSTNSQRWSSRRSRLGDRDLEGPVSARVLVGDADNIRRARDQKLGPGVCDRAHAVAAEDVLAPSPSAAGGRGRR